MSYNRRLVRYADDKDPLAGLFGDSDKSDDKPDDKSDDKPDSDLNLDLGLGESKEDKPKDSGLGLDDSKKDSLSPLSESEDDKSESFSWVRFFREKVISSPDFKTSNPEEKGVQTEDKSKSGYVHATTSSVKAWGKDGDKEVFSYDSNRKEPFKHDKSLSKEEAGALKVFFDGYGFSKTANINRRLVRIWR